MATFTEKIEMLKAANAQMNSSKDLCISDAITCMNSGRADYASTRIEKAAQYAWGFSRPANW